MKLNPYNCFQYAIEKLKSSGNIDSPEGGLDALVQVAACGKVHWWLFCLILYGGGIKKPCTGESSRLAPMWHFGHDRLREVFSSRKLYRRDLFLRGPNTSKFIREFTASSFQVTAFVVSCCHRSHSLSSALHTTSTRIKPYDRGITTIEN